MLKTRTLLAGACALFVGGAAQAQSGAEAAVDFRQGVMNVYAWNVSAMRRMARGDVPFDVAAFQSHANDLASAAGLDVLKGFPEDSITDESDARDEIWLNWSGFLEKREAFKEQAAKLAEVAATGDEAAMKEQFGKTASTCKGCHDDFKN
jgi:cytochrome c556